MNLLFWKKKATQVRDVAWNTRAIYDVACALRGPDISEPGSPIGLDDALKYLFTARIRFAVGVAEYAQKLGVVRNPKRETFELHYAEIITRAFPMSRYDHYLLHIADAALVLGLTKLASVAKALFMDYTVTLEMILEAAEE